MKYMQDNFLKHQHYVVQYFITLNINFLIQHLPVHHSHADVYLFEFLLKSKFVFKNLIRIPIFVWSKSQTDLVKISNNSPKTRI